METITFIELAKLLISFAILAPSGHNSQPWQFQVSDNEIIITPDYTKRLDVVDGNDRELFISLGCATENLMTAARHYGYDSKYDFHDGKIVVTFSKQDICNSDTLFDAITKRHTHRGNFSGAKISDNILQNISARILQDNASVKIYNSESREAEIIKQKIAEGNEIQMSDTAFKRELVSWMRFNKKHVNETHNGLCYNVLGFPATPKPIGKRIVGMFLNPKAQNKTDNAINASASHFCVFCVKDDNAKNWVDLGVFLERFLLKITTEGISYSFSNQPCEIPSLKENLRQNLNITAYPSVIIRLGYGEEPKAFAPREEVKF
ncbi:MAG: nitroreductase [Bacteroidales bacterium]|nr:nitroreductase [Bacteroidales bacterium]